MGARRGHVLLSSFFGFAWVVVDISASQRIQNNPEQMYGQAVARRPYLISSHD